MCDCQQMYVEEKPRIVDSREIFKKFPGHIKPREGMLKLQDISRKKKKVQIEVNRYSYVSVCSNV